MLGQQDWEILKPSDENGIGEERSRMAEVIVVFFSIMGNIALLNLMIALMSSVYDDHSPLTPARVNYAAIVNTIELVNTEAVIPPPFNLVVIFGLAIYFALEMTIYFFSCSRWSYNIKRIGLTSYALNKDWIKLEGPEMEKILNNNEKNDKDNNNHQGHKKKKKDKKKSNKYAPVSANKRDSDDGDSDSETDSDEEEDDDIEEEEKYNINDGNDTPNNRRNLNRHSKANSSHNVISVADEEMLIKYEEQKKIIEKNNKFWEKKDFSSLTCTNCKSQTSKKIYCRFCRNRMITNGDIKIYFYLFRHYNKSLDEADKTLLFKLSRNKMLCPSCFRPVKFYESDSARLWRWQVAMEIISFYVFMIVGYLPILLFLLIPALISWIIHKIHKKSSNYLRNDSESNAKYKQQCQLNGDNVIFGGKDINNHSHDFNNQDLEYLHVSSTIHNEYYNFIKSQSMEGNNYMILPNNNNARKNVARYRTNDNHNNGYRSFSNVNFNNDDYQFQYQYQHPMKPVHNKLLQNKNKYNNSSELSPVVDSPLPQNMNNNNTFKEILIQLTEIRKELNGVKRYQKKSKSSSNNDNNGNNKSDNSKRVSSGSKRRDSKPITVTKGRPRNRNNSQHSNKSGKSKKTQRFDEKHEEKELSIPSMPSMPSSSIQFGHNVNNIGNDNNQMIVSKHTIKPSKQQQKHDAVMLQLSPQASSHVHNINTHLHTIPHHHHHHHNMNNNNNSNNDNEYDPQQQQLFNDIIDDMSVGSIMTQTTINHIKN